MVRQGSVVIRPRIQQRQPSVQDICGEPLAEIALRSVDLQAFSACSLLRENNSKMRAQTARHLCRVPSPFMHSTCADKTRRRENSLESQDAIKRSEGQSQNATSRFLVTPILACAGRFRDGDGLLAKARSCFLR